MPYKYVYIYIYIIQKIHTYIYIYTFIYIYTAYTSLECILYRTPFLAYVFLLFTISLTQLGEHPSRDVHEISTRNLGELGTAPARVAQPGMPLRAVPSSSEQWQARNSHVPYAPCFWISMIYTYIYMWHVYIYIYNTYIAL